MCASASAGVAGVVAGGAGVPGTIISGNSAGGEDAARREPHRPGSAAGLYSEAQSMPASEAKIAHVERHFGVRFPDDYRSFLLTRGGMSEFLSPANAYVEIYAIDELIPINEAAFVQQRFPRAIVIGGNGSREMLAYDFRSAEPSLVLLDITAEDWTAALHQAPSLTALLQQLPERGWLFE